MGAAFVMLKYDGKTIGTVFAEAVAKFSEKPFLMVPSDSGRGYAADGWQASFRDVGSQVDALAAGLQRAGFGAGDRMAVLLENRPEMLILKLALAQCGVSWVPVNPDYRPTEIAYLLEDSRSAIAVVVPERRAQMDEAVQLCDLDVAVVVWDGGGLPDWPQVVGAVGGVEVGPQSEASLLYTSGTTGRPKGCIISHEYELMMGARYASLGGAAQIGESGTERIYNPLPLFHVNAGIVLFYGMLLSGNAQVIPERFSRTRFWREVCETGATGVHYLGVVIPVLMNEPAGAHDREHSVRWAFGAGVEPSLHGPFEERFGFPLVEVWGMTEMCRVLAASQEPRLVETRAMGRPFAGLEVRVVDQEDRDVPFGTPGEMVVRHSAETPRKGAFSGYLNQERATEEAWRGGWFHTGDTVTQDASGMLFFVDRKKNIIRRSGENIAAAEVEAALQGDARVAQVAVIAVADEMRDEEVMACIVAKAGSGGDALASALFDVCYAQLAYYKAPGWIVFVDQLPVTGTQKVLKHMIFGDGVDPREHAGAIDLRARKVRG